MVNSKLVELFSTFEKGEFKRFREFINSPFFNKNKELLLFYNDLAAQAPSFKAKKLQKEAIYARVFPDKRYNEKHLGYLMSDLLQLAEQFIGLTTYLEKPILPDYHILSSQIKRDLNKHFNYRYKKTVDKLKKTKQFDNQLLYDRFLLSELAEKQFEKTQLRKFDPRLQNLADRFDEYYLLTKMRYVCEMLDRQKIISADYKMNMVDEITMYLKSKDYTHIPIINMQFHVLMMLIDEDGELYFSKLKVLLNKYALTISPYEMKQMFFSAINFCIRKIRHGNEAYISECLDLYLKGIDTEIILEDGFLSPWTYTNVKKLALFLKRYEWTESFIYEYNNKLANQFRENALHFNLADLYYYQKNFDKSIDHLNQVALGDIHYNLDSKVILMKIYYEKDEEEALLSLIASFSIFIKRNKGITGDVGKPYLNFCGFTKKLLRNNTAKFGELKEKIEGTQLLTEKKWLLEMLSKKINK